MQQIKMSLIKNLKLYELSHLFLFLRTFSSQGWTEHHGPHIPVTTPKLIVPKCLFTTANQKSTKKYGMWEITYLPTVGLRVPQFHYVRWTSKWSNEWLTLKRQKRNSKFLHATTSVLHVLHQKLRFHYAMIFIIWRALNFGRLYLF